MVLATIFYSIQPAAIVAVIMLILLCAVLIGVTLRHKVQDFYNKVNSTKASLEDVRSQIYAESQRLLEMTSRKAKMSEWLDELSRQKENLEEALAEMQKDLDSIEKELIQKRHEAEIEVVREQEQKRAAYVQQLEAEYETLKKDSRWDQLRKELEELNSLIDLGKKTLNVVDKKVIDKVSQEEFTAMHSIKISEQDKDDIKIIFDLCSHLNRKESIRKLVWTEFYQKPLQQLRKDLNCDKMMGIYRITNQRDQRCYIGQSTDIGGRFAEHVKSAVLSIRNYQTSKFYSAMAVEGPESFTYEILELCDQERLNERERYWIEFYNAKTLGYNMTIGG